MRFIATLLCLLPAAALAQSNAGPINTPRINSRFYAGTKQYPTVQSAVTAACGAGGGTVVRDFMVVTNDQPANAVGCTAAIINDNTTLPATSYSYQNGYYVAIPNSGGGAQPAAQAYAVNFTDATGKVLQGDSAFVYQGKVLQMPSFQTTGGASIGGVMTTGGGQFNGAVNFTSSITSSTASGSAAAFQVGNNGAMWAQSVLAAYPRVDATLPNFGQTDGSGNQASGVINQATFQAAINAAVKANSTTPAVYVPPGQYAITGTLDIPNTLRLYSDSRIGAALIETPGSAPLVRVRGAGCYAYSCYGGVEDLTLEGSNTATTGALLELDSGFFILRGVHFFNTGGRGLQLNGASERIVSYDSSFYQVRWPLILAGDSNENYFFNTHVIEAGEVTGSGTFGRYCYSVNCVNGNYPPAGTAQNPTVLVSDPHASIDIDKAVNVAFIGGSFKSSPMLAETKVWAGGNIRFENIYTENPEVFGNPTNNKSYIIGGKAEQTYMTAALGSSATSVSVANTDWMPQLFGSSADVLTNNGNYYAYVILPQDFKLGSTTPSAYNSNVQQGQVEVVNTEGFTQGMFYIQPGGRNAAGSTAPSGTTWPAGSIVQEYPESTQADVAIVQPHMNTVQGVTSNGWTYNCVQTDYRNCAEVTIGVDPDVVSLSSNPATNLNGFSQPYGTTNSINNSLNFSLTLDDPNMYNSPSVPSTGLVLAEGNATVNVRGSGGNPQTQNTSAATVVTNGGVSVLLDSAGGSSVFAPMYSSGSLANVTVNDDIAGERWNSQSGWYQKYTSVFKPYQQYGQFMNGTQFQNLLCDFDLAPVAGGFGSGLNNQSMSRFCVTGGPTNTQIAKNAGSGYGYGAEWDMWNPTLSVWQAMMRAWSGGLYTQGAFTAAQINGEWTVDGIAYTTLNQVWTAAAAAATSSGQPQTIRLGPGNFPVTAQLVEPTNGACVSLIGSSGTTTGSDIANVGTEITAAILPFTGGIISLGNQTLTEGCTFRDFTLNVAESASSGFQMQWYRGMLIENVTVNDPMVTGYLMGESSGSHQSIGSFHNLATSISTTVASPSTRAVYGFQAQVTAIDSVIDGLVVRNALTAAFENAGGGWTTHNIHGFGYPYTCTTGPCNNTETNSAAADASWASNYVVEDTGTGGNVYADTYIDSPAIAGFHVKANGVQINGGHIQWPELTSFPAANLADVEATVTSNLIISNISCSSMSSTAGTGLQAGAGVWVSFQGTGSAPPAYSTIENLAGCGDYYQSKSGASQTAFERGNANYSNTNPGLTGGLNPKVWASPLAAGGNYAAFAAQLYSSYLGDEYAGGYSGQPLNYHVDHNGSILTRGGLTVGAVSVTAATTLTTANADVLANATNGAFTVTLPSCYTPLADDLTPYGLQMTIMKTDTSANAVTLATVSSQTINVNGSTSTGYTLASAGAIWLGCGTDNNWYAYSTTSSRLVNQVGFQVVSTPACTYTAGTFGSGCSTTVTLASSGGVAEPDANYIVSGCALAGGTGSNLVGPITSPSTTSFVVAVVAGNTTAAGGGTLACTVVHK